MSAETFVPDIVAEDYFEIIPTQSNWKPVGMKELRQIQADIKRTMRPSWQQAPPSNLGEASHGKLKADQWRTLIEFDIPVSLVKLWSKLPEDNGDVHNVRCRKLMESTMLLATALRWATSRRTSANHAKKYTENMRAYLHTLRDLFPDRDLRPNHHNALLVGEMLMRFGPVHGWWCFPYERVIGKLQQINTNSKMGTYLFC